MQLARKKVLRSLKRKGFKQAEGARHTLLTYHDKEDKKPGITTLVGRGSGYKSLGDTLVGDMAQQCGLTTAQFEALVNCPMSRDEYDNIVAEAE